MIGCIKQNHPLFRYNLCIIAKDKPMPHLFDSLTLRGVTLRNRIGVSPMCQYSATDGLPDDWHLQHLVSRAVGGAGLVMTEATAITPEGRITPHCTGIWSAEQVAAWLRITTQIKAQGAAVGIQLAHAGRKASTSRPWDGDGILLPDDGGWQVLAPSAVPFRTSGGLMPHAMTETDIQSLIQAWRTAAICSQDAGFDLIEIHAAHGYLLHSFLSPLANQRTDAYGGTFEKRVRLLLEVVQAVRSVWSEAKPLFVRLSASDWREDGWTIDDSVLLAQLLLSEGVDLVDCSSGGIVPGVHIPSAPGYQVPFAEAIRTRTGMPTAAVGMITDPAQADAIVREGRADMVLLGLAMLDDPYWALHAADALGQRGAVTLPMPYARAF